MEVNIGREDLIFESGPFTYFGIQTLNQVIESPSSPLLAYKVQGNAVGTPSSTTSNDINFCLFVCSGALVIDETRKTKTLRNEVPFSKNIR